MKNVVGELRPALTLFLILTLLTGAAYPLLVTGVGQAFFDDAVNGSIIERGQRRLGSELLGQQFTSPRYLWGRPSATASHAYNGAASGGSNLGPMNPALEQAVRERITKLRAADPGNDRAIPVDLVTASGSGLDPHISPAAAEYQVPRVARERRRSEAEIRELVRQASEGRTFAILGEPRVNVLKLNLLLDAAATDTE